VTRGRWFAWSLAAITAGALALRIAYVLIERRDLEFTGDAFFYHEGANLLADGRGFISPVELEFFDGRVAEAADHPPAYLVYLAIPSFVGLDTELAHLLWSCLAGAATVVLTGLLGRAVGGPRVGVIAAIGAAVYPNVWAHDGALLSETLAIAATTATVLLAYHYLAAPSWRRLAATGAMAGLAALTRSELVLLLPLLVVPLALRTRTIDVRQRWKWVGAGATATALVLSPWVAFNLTRFDKPVLLSSQFGGTLAVANCDDTYYGRFLGYWSLQCSVPIALEAHEDGLDQSGEEARLRKHALDYISDHKTRVPVVVAARWGRMTGVFRPGSYIDLEQLPEGREKWLAYANLFSLWLVLALAVAGVIVMRRRRAPLFPLLVPPLIVLIAVTIAFYNPRYRAAAETSLVVLAAVAIDAAIARLRREPVPHLP
jgi:4-amino-4-deoxy-L-arabinose transferase-like glycosyltransferase